MDENPGTSEKRVKKNKFFIHFTEIFDIAPNGFCFRVSNGTKISSILKHVRKVIQEELSKKHFALFGNEMRGGTNSYRFYFSDNPLCDDLRVRDYDMEDGDVIDSFPTQYGGTHHGIDMFQFNNDEILFSIVPEAFTVYSLLRSIIPNMTKKRHEREERGGRKEVHELKNSNIIGAQGMGGPSLGQIRNFEIHSSYEQVFEVENITANFIKESRDKIWEVTRIKAKYNKDSDGFDCKILTSEDDGLEDWNFQFQGSLRNQDSILEPNKLYYCAVFHFHGGVDIIIDTFVNQVNIISSYSPSYKFLLVLTTSLEERVDYVRKHIESQNHNEEQRSFTSSKFILHR